MKIVSTDQLIELNLIAVERGYNRQISEDILEALDPLGTHVIYFDMLHEHKAGKKTKPHIRVVLRCKLEDKPFIDLQLDCDLKKYLALEDV